MHAVKIGRFGEGVTEPMLQMLAWARPSPHPTALIEFSFHPGKEIRFRLTFCAAGEAVAFAQAFQGEVLSGLNSNSRSRDRRFNWTANLRPTRSDCRG
jgi:hypothetical protein